MSRCSKALPLRAGMTLDTFSALPKMKKTAFNMINLIYFFTYGPKEARLRERRASGP